MFKTIDRYEETGLGLPYAVILVESAEAEIDESTGEVVGVSVPDMEQLVASVAIVRVLEPTQMTGREIRFIRQAIGMTATAFAEAICLDKATYSRWENDKQECGEWAEKQVRLIAVVKLAGKVPHLTLDPTQVVEMRLRKRVPGHWPHIEMYRVPADGSPTSLDHEEAWDAVPLALAA